MVAFGEAETIIHRRLPSHWGLRMLVVEDDYPTADALCDELEALGVLPLPPSPSVERAMERLAVRPVDAAILDVNLKGSFVFPLAHLLMDMRKPFVFYTGYDAITIPARFRSVPVCPKPSSAAELLRAIMTNPGYLWGRSAKFCNSNHSEVVNALPQLRAFAFLITGEKQAADDLVDAALRRAVENVAKAQTTPIEEWLKDLIEDCAREQGYKTIH